MPTISTTGVTTYTNANNGQTVTVSVGGSLVVELWGPGAGGSRSASRGLGSAGSGGYSKKTYVITAGQTFLLTLPLGGVGRTGSAGAGADPLDGAYVGDNTVQFADIGLHPSATTGNGGQGSSSSIGDVVHEGAAGGTGSTNGASGGGGGAGGPTGPGTVGSNAVTTTPGTGGVGGGTNSGTGGTGGISGAAGANGGNYGAGGGSGGTGANGGNGGDSLAVFTFTKTPVASSLVSKVGGDIFSGLGLNL